MKCEKHFPIKIATNVAWIIVEQILLERAIIVCEKHIVIADILDIPWNMRNTKHRVAFISHPVFFTRLQAFKHSRHYRMNFNNLSNFRSERRSSFWSVCFLLFLSNIRSCHANPERYALGIGSAGNWQPGGQEFNLFAIRSPNENGEEGRREEEVLWKFIHVVWSLPQAWCNAGRWTGGKGSTLNGLCQLWHH